MNINNKIINLINKYQTNKPANYQPRCVHYPSCSEYSKQCYQKFNFFKATFYTIKRIIGCVPFNKKYYDPIPKSKQEKDFEKQLVEEASLIKPIILAHYQKYPKMTIEDFVKLIYQNTFGPYHLYNPDKQKIITYLKQELLQVSSPNKQIEDIGNNYVRIYLNTQTDIECLANSFYQSTLVNTFNQENIHLFFLKINILIKLIKKKKIKLPKKASIIFLNQYLANGITPVHHSKIYNQTYSPHYRVVNKNILKE